MNCDSEAIHSFDSIELLFFKQSSLKKKLNWNNQFITACFYSLLFFQ